ncbi:hypothetical protein [Phenylobacterium deserti]|uniref:Uncharacterized protein n=1 Tax=Phenylobacterium deserti TaxID=1914756 RepID=A0A328AFA9_9CAUL|nr:hypothetical protein [Phenylobacterium deserti]RAK52806.1 hypothetical protein DJ018_11520 [Phenylobacterium deserti]
MLVYGDRARRLAPRKALRALTATLKTAEEAGAGVARHDLLTDAFVQASGLMQGFADAEFDQRGFDDLSPMQEACANLLLALAKKLAASAWSGYASSGPPIALELMAVALQPAPDAISVKTPEGYAFYASYPEGFLKAAIEHRWDSPPLVIGLRSIGTGLAALVAAAANAKTFYTLRPTGEPFRRRMQASEALRQLFASHAGPFAIVDEGPGLSGSSFGATADLLEELGVSPERIVFLPSHPGDLGPEASPQHRARWAAAQRPVATFRDLQVDEPLEQWFADLMPPIDRIEDLSGGAWRKDLRTDAWPPANPAQERLKFRLTTATGAWLAKFAGLGAIGQGKFERAQALHRAGFSPEPLALRRGFLLERWEPGEIGVGPDRQEFVEHLGRYLGFRASAFPADPEQGARLDELAEMARVNAGELLGTHTAEALEPRLAWPEDVARPVHIDGRLHSWEWRISPDGLLLKTDALDHSEAHDLLGCQDIAWDVAGAAVEFDLTDEEVQRVCAGVEAVSGFAVDPRLLAFFALCYPAFQAGLWRFAAGSAGADEQPRISAHAARYAERLTALAAN